MIAVHTSGQRQRGFTMIELAIVVSILLVLVGIALFQVQPSLRQARADAAAAYVKNQIRSARQRAIDERRNYKVTFVAPTTINLFQGTYDAQSNATIYTLVSSLDLPDGMQFQLPVVKPSISPDGFDDSDAIDFSVLNSTTPTDTIVLRPDGSIVDGSVTGPTNGALFMALSTDPNSARAVSVFGATGRVKSWRISGSQSSPTWMEQ
jgi:prepilin-type N-terminal cleavage/methylation domain-containing protein